MGCNLSVQYPNLLTLFQAKPFLKYLSTTSTYRTPDFEERRQEEPSGVKKSPYSTAVLLYLLPALYLWKITGMAFAVSSFIHFSFVFCFF